LPLADQGYELGQVADTADIVQRSAKQSGRRRLFPQTGAQEKLSQSGGTSVALQRLTFELVRVKLPYPSGAKKVSRKHCH
jgi:hypothetical protein